MKTGRFSEIDHLSEFLYIFMKNVNLIRKIYLLFRKKLTLRKKICFLKNVKLSENCRLYPKTFFGKMLTPILLSTSSLQYNKDKCDYNMGV